MRPLIYFLSFVFILAFSKVSFAQFTGDFDHSNWELNDSQGGTIQQDEDHLILTGSEDLNGTIEYSITPIEDMLISFDWHYQSTAAQAYSDMAYYKLDNQYHNLPYYNYDLDQAGKRVVYIKAGSTFSFVQQSDGCCGNASLHILNFSFEFASDPVGGISCASASPVNAGEKILSNAQNGRWHSVTIPNVQNAKLVINASEYVQVYAYQGTCNNYSFVSSDYGYRPVLTGLSANQTVFLLMYTFQGAALPWTFQVEEAGAGESCGSAIPATLGTNAAVVPENANYLWYSYTMPVSQKVVISSDASEYIEIRQGQCGLSYVEGSSSDIEVTDVPAGSQFYIRWTTTYNGTDFNWQLAEEDFADGDLCSTAIQAVEGLNESESDGGYTWFKFTMPNEEGKKLVITSDSPASLRVTEGTCDNITNYHYGYPDLTLAELAPNQEVLIRWDMYNGGTLSWNIAIEDITDGDLCAQPLPVVIEGENVIPPNSYGEMWFDLVMPEDPKKLVITSTNSYSYAYVYTGSCENLGFRSSFDESGKINTLAPGEHVFIRWALYNGGDFSFTVTFEDLGPAETCSSAVTASVGENHLSTNTAGYYYYVFTMPEGASKKLSISTNESNYIRLYKGTCDALTPVGQNYYNLTSENLLPGETVIIGWILDYDLDFNWNLELEDIPPGQACSAAIDASIGLNNTTAAPRWFDYTMPGTGNITISSVGLTNTNTYLRVYDACGGVQLALNDNFQNLQSKITLNNVTSGTTLKILWDNTWSSAGFDWSISLQNVSQSITFGELNSRTIIDGPFELEASATSGLPITFVSDNENVVTINGSTVTVIGVGDATITASQPGNASFNAAQPVMRTLTITKASQTISFNDLPQKTINDADFDLTASASSSLPVVFESSNPNVATINGNTVSIVGVGQTTITASQGGNDIYNAASSILRTLTVTKATQTITFAHLADKTVGDPAFEISASASSGLPVTFVSSNSSVATIAGTSVTIVGAGTTTITASQAGNDTYAAATPVVRTLKVTANQTITFDALPAKTFGDAAFQLSASSTSGLPVTFEVSNPEIAGISGNTLTILHAGTVSVTAKQSGNELYNAAASVVRTLVINKKSQQISFANLSNKTFGDAAFTVNASSSESLPITYASSDPSIASVSGNTVSLVSAGSVTITASQSGNGDIQAAQSVARTFCVNPVQPQITANFNDDGAPVLTSSAASGNQWHKDGQQVQGSTAKTHTVNSAGSYTVVASAGTCNSLPSASFTVVITDITPTDNKTRIYPNPASDHLTVEGVTNTTEMEFVSMQGVVTKANVSPRSSSGRIYVDIAGLSSGVYFLILKEKGSVSRLKFIKQ